MVIIPLAQEDDGKDVGEPIGIIPLAQEDDGDGLGH